MIYGATSGPFYNESLSHFKAKMRIATLLDKEGWDVWVDDMKGFAILALTKLFGYDYIPREYRFDIYAEKLLKIQIMVNLDEFGTGQLKNITLLLKVIIEVDYKGHLTKWSKHKGDMRDAEMEKKKIATVRFPIKWLCGNKKLDDETILKEIEHCQLTLLSNVSAKSA